MPDRVAYMPLNTYPEAAPDAAILAAIGFAGALGCGLHVSAFAVDIPQMSPRLGGFLLDVQGMAHRVEQRSQTECDRLVALVQGAAGPDLEVQVLKQTLVLGAALDAAATEARYFDLALLPWSADAPATKEMAQSIVFGSGCPAILVPPVTPVQQVDHIAIAWDESRVAARALCDALPLLAAGGRVSILTVQDEKALQNTGMAATLAASLERRGYLAKAVDLVLDGRSIAAALQDGARAEGAQMLAMGGFGHSRLRDFILGGATQGVFDDLRLPVLLSH